MDYNPVSGYWSLNALTEYVSSDTDVLVIGCGKGHNAIKLAQISSSVVGIDINANAIETAKALAQESTLESELEFVHGDFLEHDFKDKLYDVVILVRVLTCISDNASWNAMLNKSRRLLRDSALLYVRDFLLSPIVYAERYEVAKNIGLPYGQFWASDGTEFGKFIARHHSTDEIQKILGNLSLIKLEKEKSMSMNGNSVNTFELIAKKVTYAD
ncbi:MAG: class I SAM-dependent methyltransferase [Hellea sp.]